MIKIKLTIEKMSAKTVILCIGLSFILTSCLKEGEENKIDLEAPAIKVSNGSSTIQPSYFFSTNANNPQIPLAFKITDDTGIREVKLESHSGFDGHTHGKSSQRKNPKFKFFSFNKVFTSVDFENPKQFTYESTIYLDDRNPEIKEDELVLSGPYHFSIQATDLEGNETNYRDNTTYHTTLYLNQSYAPLVQVSSIDLTSKSISGQIYRNMQHEASSDIIFLWIYVQTPHNNATGQEGTITKERIWGSSNWPHQSRPVQGDPLPSGQVLDIQELLGGDNDFFSALPENILVVWAEDANGNISVNHFNNQ